MLILLTNKCNEVCTHCMNCSNPMGWDYEPELLNPLMRYLKALSPTHVHISGGEFTLANNWFDTVVSIIESSPQHLFSFGSNGWWIEDKEMCEKIKNLCKFSRVQHIQISSHKSYYPNYEFTSSHKEDYEAISPKVRYMENWQGNGNGSSNLHRLGRAVNLISEDEVKGYPGCAPVLTRVKQSHMLGIYKYDTFVEFLIHSGYSCKPCIDLTTGKIRVGESRECMDFDSLHYYKGASTLQVRNLQNESFERMKTLKFCDKCKAKKNIPANVLLTLNL